METEFQKEYMIKLKLFLKAEYQKNKVIFPEKKNYFEAFRLTPLTKLKVVILGQDPYHGPGQAHGLSFSVPPGQRPPPSLMNIFKELETDVGVIRPSSGYLEKWAKSGVFLLNSVLTVESGKPGSHQNQGWKTWTDRVIQVISEQKQHVVFMLWGSQAQKKIHLIDTVKHLVLQSVHPSPLSAYRGFLGSKPFSKANNFLTQKKLEAVDWRL